MNTVDSRVCTVCGQPATAPDVKYMEPRCLEHAHVLRPPDTGRRMFWRLGEDERLRRGLGLPVPNARQAKTLASEDAKLAGTGVSRADYGSLELRVLVSVMSRLTKEVVREMSQNTAMDETTASAMVEATIRTFASNGPLRAEELRTPPQQKHIGYMVCVDGRYMYWPVEGLQEARTYCEDNVEPVKLMADVAELNKHEEGQV